MTIDLLSAITGKISTIGTMYITNDGAGTQDRGNYNVAVARRGTTLEPHDLAAAVHTGKVTDYPRRAYNVWRLIARATLASFPEEVKTKPGNAYAATAVPAVMRGLNLLREHYEDDWHAWSPEQVSDVDLACDWLKAAEDVNDLT